MKARDEFCQNAMFANAKLRLLMGVVGFERIGVEDVPGASWVIPPTMTSSDLRDAISNISQTLVNPMPEGSTEDPRTLLARKNASARNSSAHELIDVNFGSESEGEDTVPDGFLFPPNPRSKSDALDELKKKRKKKTKATPESEPLDDETLEARRQSRLTNALARQQKIKSDLFIHASDEESDAEADAEFFRLEEGRRLVQAENIKKAMLHGIVETSIAKGKKKASIRKRQSDTGASAAAKPKRQRRGSSSAGSGMESDGDDDILMAEMEAQSPQSPQEASTSKGSRDNEDTPLTSAEDEMDFDEDFAISRNRNLKPSVPEDDADEDDEEAPVVSSRRRVGGFVIDSDSE